MSEPLRPARLDWSQGAPFSADFSDIYFSCAGGDAEKNHVFIEQNHLPQRFSALTEQQSLTVIETGFGTGLNWLATLHAWQRNSRDGWLHFVSAEKHPLTPADLQTAQACWPHYAAFAEALQKNYPALLPGFHRIVFPQWRSTLTLFWGDVTEFLPRLSATADAWFLDGFAPERNAGMWTGTLYESMAAHSHADTTMATFTAAGHVRRGLMAAGFVMEKVPGFGKKREMLRGRFSESAVIASRKSADSPWLHRPAPEFSETTACVIGAGIAGASTANRLALRGWQVTVFESAEQVAAGASGNPAAIIYPRAAATDQQYDNFPQQAYEFALQEFSNLPEANSLWHPCGVLKLLAGNQERGRSRQASSATEFLDAAEASEKAGTALSHDALWHPQAGWLDAAAWCRELLSAENITVKTNTTVEKLQKEKNGWALFDADGNLLLECAIVIVANSLSALNLRQTRQLPLQSVRGQVSLVSPSALSSKIKTVICHDGYLTPPLTNGEQCLGATFHPEKNDTTVHLSEHAENRGLLREFVAELADSLPAIETWQGRAALRCQSIDYLPLLGPVADHDDFMQAYEGLRDGRREDYTGLAALPGLYVNLAHGSKGFSQAALAAEILAAEINHEPAPVSQKVLNALHPMRFWARQLKRHKNRN